MKALAGTPPKIPTRAIASDFEDVPLVRVPRDGSTPAATSAMIQPLSSLFTATSRGLKPSFSKRSTRFFLSRITRVGVMPIRSFPS
jgi:hypothetical protein